MPKKKQKATLVDLSELEREWKSTGAATAQRMRKGGREGERENKIAFLVDLRRRGVRSVKKMLTIIVVWSALPNIHFLCIWWIKTFWYNDMSDVTVIYGMLLNFIAFSEYYFHIIEDYSSLKCCISTKVSLIVFLTNTHILICWHARCDCKLRKVRWFNCFFFENFSVWYVISSSNFHKFCGKSMQIILTCNPTICNCLLWKCI